MLMAKISLIKEINCYQQEEEKQCYDYQQRNMLALINLYIIVIDGVLRLDQPDASPHIFIYGNIGSRQMCVFYQPFILIITIGRFTQPFYYQYQRRRTAIGTTNIGYGRRYEVLKGFFLLF